jgi:hypothetical protein
MSWARPTAKAEHLLNRVSDRFGAARVGPLGLNDAHGLMVDVASVERLSALGPGGRTASNAGDLLKPHLDEEVGGPL